MIVEEKFGFIHIPKTGGSFVRTIVEKSFPYKNIKYFRTPPSDRYGMENNPRFSQHHSFDEISPEYQNLPMITFIRNPWDWYVSWFHFHTKPERLNLPEEWAKRWRRRLTEGFKQTATNNLHAYMNKIKEYTNYPNVPPNLILKNQDNLSQELSIFLSKYGNAQSAELAKTHRKINITSRGHYSNYYDDELKEAIEEYYKDIIELFNFTFEDKS